MFEKILTLREMEYFLGEISVVGLTTLVFVSNSTTGSAIDV
jgi:hypothetical protein